MLYRDDNDWMIWIKLDKTQLDACTMIFPKTDWKTLENWLRCWENRVFSTFATRFCCGIPPRTSRRRIFCVDDLYHIQYWRVLIKPELVRLLSMRRVNKCQISELYVYSLMLGTAYLDSNNQLIVDKIVYDIESYETMNIVVKELDDLINI